MAFVNRRKFGVYSASSGGTGGGDTTAPSLSSPLGTATSGTTATLSVTTNEANGVLYAVVTTSSTPPSVTQVKAGQNNAGTSAVFASNQSISSTGTKTFSATGLSAVPCYAYFVHTDAAGNNSAVSSAASFTPSSVSTMTLTGTGFGTNADYAPLFFLDFRTTNNGDTWMQAVSAGGGVGWANGTQYNPATLRVDMSNGIPMGGGCILTDANIALSQEFFTDHGIDINTKTFTVFKHTRLDLLDPPNHTGILQVKGLRTTCGVRDYAGIPRVHPSNYLGSDLAYGEPTGHYRAEWHIAEDINAPRDSDTPRPLANGQWHCQFKQVGLNTIQGDNATISAADAVYKHWMDGIMYFNESNLDLTDDPTNATFRSFLPSPGLANEMAGNHWQLREARIAGFRGYGFVAFGNASTFAACTDLLVVEPTSWSDTAITFNPRGTRPTGYNWMYVSTTSRNINANGLTSFA